MTPTQDDHRPWYERAFDRVYREVYPHRSDEQAETEVAFAQSLMQFSSTGRTILDLCCGHGRHAAAWVKSGFRVIGLDLSRDLIEAARDRRLDASLFLRGDMRRLPFHDDSFDAVTSFFTSFGYFADEAEDLQVLKEIRRALKSEAPFILDFLNASRVRASLVPHSQARRAGYEIEERRRIDQESRRVIKDVFIRDQEGQEHHYQESVRLYDQDELLSLCKSAELLVRSTQGDLTGSDFAAATSDRLVIYGVAP